MPVIQSLLEILCCPKTRQPLRQLSLDEIRQLNEKIASGKLSYADGNPVDKALTEALITEDGQTVYRVDDDIPIMLPEKAIPLTVEGTRGE